MPQYSQRRKWSGIRVVVFDMDDTLYPEVDYAMSGFSAVGDWLLLHEAMDGFFNVAGTLFRDGRRGDVFDAALAKLGCSETQISTLVPQMVGVYRGHIPHIDLSADACWALDWSAGGAKLGLISDGYLVAQQNKVRALNLSRWIDSIILTDELGPHAWKPAPLAFELTMQRFGGVAGDYVYIGDNPAKDFKAPRRLGWKTVQVRRAGGEYRSRLVAPGGEADVQVGDLRELEALMGLAGKP
jgi:putative hydrolase of the HAD superfamily